MQRSSYPVLPSPPNLSSRSSPQAMFDHFVGTLHSRCRVVSLDAGDVDYRERLLAASGPARDVPAYTWPLSPATHATMDAAWAQLCAGVPPQERGPATIQVAFGRTLTIEDVAGGAARVPFSQLCATTTGPTDFMALASSFHTIMITGVSAGREGRSGEGVRSSACSVQAGCGLGWPRSAWG